MYLHIIRQKAHFFQLHHIPTSSPSLVNHDNNHAQDNVTPKNLKSN
uniref:Uncharacterized protein n=1 Tax=Arundo donax TaxID=35708 RepID=A0A0A8ZM74_ARUDO